MQVLIISPRGFCAGVVRALNIVEGAIEKYGKTHTIYVKHEIVHNKYVVDYFKTKGVKFVESASEITTKHNIVIFSAHGVSTKIENDFSSLAEEVVDATCPLVQKVHTLAKKFEEQQSTIILIGHKNHPEVIGTMGRVSSKMILVETVEDVENLSIENTANIAYLTQTTLSIDETTEVIEALKRKFPNIKSSKNSDICYATQNRQDAVKMVIHKLDGLIVMGSESSSNSNRLRDIGTINSIDSILINNLSELPKEWCDGKSSVGITSGASSPELLLNEVAEFLKTKYNAKIQHFQHKTEDIEFHTPKSVRIKDCPLV